ncbi:hypothetical protein HN51_066341, partial [Arachis hypogaea]
DRPQARSVFKISVQIWQARYRFHRASKYYKRLKILKYLFLSNSLIVLWPLLLNRLQSELMALMMSGDSGISAFPEEDNILCWKGTITGSKDLCLKELSISCHFRFPMITLLRLQKSNLKAPASIQM